MTVEDCKNDFIKRAKSNKFHFNRKKYLESLWLNDRDLRLSVYRKLFETDALSLEDYEQCIRSEGYEL